MIARVHIDGAILARDIEIIESPASKHHAEAMLELGGGNTIEVKILGSLRSLFALKEQVHAKDIVDIRGRMIGNQKHFITCWAQSIKKR